MAAAGHGTAEHLACHIGRLDMGIEYTLPLRDRLFLYGRRNRRRSRAVDQAIDRRHPGSQFLVHLRQGIKVGYVDLVSGGPLTQLTDTGLDALRIDVDDADVALFIDHSPCECGANSACTAGNYHTVYRALRHFPALVLMRG